LKIRNSRFNTLNLESRISNQAQSITIGRGLLVALGNLWLFLRVNICAISETSLGFPGPASLYGKSQVQTLPRFGKVGLYTHGG